MGSGRVAPSEERNAAVTESDHSWSGNQLRHELRTGQKRELRETLRDVFERWNEVFVARTEPEESEFIVDVTEFRFRGPVMNVWQDQHHTVVLVSGGPYSDLLDASVRLYGCLRRLEGAGDYEGRSEPRDEGQVDTAVLRCREQQVREGCDVGGATCYSK